MHSGSNRIRNLILVQRESRVEGPHCGWHRSDSRDRPFYFYLRNFRQLTREKAANIMAAF